MILGSILIVELLEHWKFYQHHRFLRAIGSSVSVFMTLPWSVLATQSI